VQLLAGHEHDVEEAVLMRPFQQVRLWLRSGPTAERAATAVAAAVALVLVVWAGMPTGTGATGSEEVLGSGPVAGEGGTAVGTGGTTGGAGGTSGTTGATTGAIVGGSSGGTTVTGTSGGGLGTTTGTATGGGASGTTSTGGSGTVSRPTTTCLQAPAGQGVSATTITVGVILPTIGALNSALHIPSEADQQKGYNAVFADINKRGGAQCRKLVAKFYSDNPLDSSTGRAACLQIQQDKVFAVINNLFNSEVTTCVAQAKVPNFWYTTPHVNAIKKYAPYILSFQADYDRLQRNYVFGAKAVGWFKGVKKIGILDQTCYPDLSSNLRTFLTQAGFPSSTWSVYNYGCSTSGTGQEPDKDTAAAVQFRRDGATHVMSTAYGKSSQFAKAAEQQGYRPKYVVMSDAQIQANNHTTPPQTASFDGALDITSDQIGSLDTPGYKHTKATLACRKVIRDAGLADILDSSEGTGGTLYGVACASSTMLVNALQRIPVLQRSSLAAGLARAGSLELSFPAGPSVYNDPTNPTGGQFWRPAAFRTSCNCWQVTSLTWRKGY
jgi:hypothetical protein